MKSILQNTFTLSLISLVLTSCSSEPIRENVVYNSPSNISKSLAACHQKDYSEGKENLEKYMSLEKANPIYWNAIGICYALSGDLEKANFFYNIGLESLMLYKAHDRNQAESALRNNIGLIHLNYNRYNDAYMAFTAALKLSPDLFEVQLNLSHLYLQFKHDDKALIILKNLENFRPGDVDVITSLALIYARSNEYEKALLTLSKINNENTSRPDIAGIYSYNLLKANQVSEASAMIDKRTKQDEYEGYNLRNKILENQISAKLKEIESLKK